MATDLAAEVITPDQLAVLPDHVNFELVDGQLLERHIGNKSSWVGTRLAKLLSIYVDDQGLGWVFASEGGYRLNPTRPNTVRKPDVSFVAVGRLPNEEPADAYDRLAPDFAAEVISPGDTVRELDEKVEEYLLAGVRLVWVINPELQVVRIHYPDGQLKVARGEDVLDGGDVMPGFRCLVSDLFKRPVPRKRD
jgi:Uma2 family endonuclease